MVGRYHQLLKTTTANIFEVFPWPSGEKPLAGKPLKVPKPFPWKGSGVFEKNYLKSNDICFSLYKLINLPVENLPPLGFLTCLFFGFTELLNQIKK